MVMPPVLASKKTRDDYDTTWMLWPWEHPAAYWLRSNGENIVCTRCGKSTAQEPHALDEDREALAQAFTESHLRCPLGFGPRGPKPSDPIFATP